jgi:hypothetical protein
MINDYLAASSFSLNARAEDERQYTEGPVTEVDYLQVKLSDYPTPQLAYHTGGIQILFSRQVALCEP